MVNNGFILRRCNIFGIGLFAIVSRFVYQKCFAINNMMLKRTVIS